MYIIIINIYFNNYKTITIFKYMQIRITFILYTSWKPDFSIIKTVLLEYSKYLFKRKSLDHSDKQLVS